MGLVSSHPSPSLCLELMVLGYNSSAAAGLQKRLLEGSAEFKVHSRVLGNVFYLMASQVSKRETLLRIESLLLEAIP